MTAVSVVELPVQIVMSVSVMSKFVMVALLVPGHPRVAPLGINSVNACELVVPLFPPFELRAGVPEETAM